MRAALAFLLVACATDAQLDYDCRLVYSCGESGLYTRFPVTGTVLEVTEWAREWNDACAALTKSQVHQCGSVLCAALCSPVEE